MTSPDNAIINFVLCLLFVMTLMYAVGRLHQWFRQGTERDDAYRDGYDTATTSLFTVATRAAKAIQPNEDSASVTEITDAPSARHRAEDLLSKTRRLNNIGGKWSA